MEPSQEKLQSMFTYTNGELLWKAVKGKANSFVGHSAGAASKDGRIYVRIDYVLYRRSRLVYVYHFGQIPEGLIIDHRNGNSADDRIGNLRIATQGENLLNQDVRGRNLTGIKGVYYDKRDETFYVRVRTKHLGTFKTLEEATSVRQKYIKLHYPEFGNV